MHHLLGSLVPASVLRPVTRYFLIGLLFVGPYGWVPVLRAQSAETGSVAGTVLSGIEGRPVSGAIVTVRGTTLGAQADSEGRYQIDDVPPATHSLLVVKSGFQRTTISEVKVAAGQVTRADVQLRPEYYEMETYEVIAEPFEQQDVILLEERQMANVVIDSIGSEFFSQAAVSDAADIMTKVTGASVVGGRYVFIRGLGDRYSATLLNGLHVPSTDPDKKALQMDLFPAGLIGSVQTAKTFSPDRPGGFTGGVVNIRTKSFPDHPFLEVSVGTGYNPQANLQKKFLTYDQGGTGRFGENQGAGELPGTWADPNFNQRIDARREIIEDRDSTEAQKAAAVEELRSLNGQLPQTMGTKTSRSGLDESYSILAGTTHPIWGRNLGVIGGFNYSLKYDFYDDGERNKLNTNGNTDTISRLRAADQTKGTETLTYSAFSNVAYEVTEDTTVEFTAIYINKTDDEAVLREGFDASEGVNIEEQVLNFNDRDLFVIQGGVDSTLTDFYDDRIELKASYSETGQDEPDLRYIEVEKNPVHGSTSIDPSTQRLPLRVFRSIDESNGNLVFDNTLPFDLWAPKEHSWKFGASFNRTERDFMEDVFQYSSDADYPFLGTDPDPADFPENGHIDVELNRFGRGRTTLYPERVDTTTYQGIEDIVAGYSLVDLRIGEKWRLISGARYETTDMNVHFNTLTKEDASDLSEAHILPAASLVYEITEKMSVRAAYGATVARPTFKEFTGISVYDPVLNVVFTGNPDLAMTETDNYDLRWDWFPNPGDVLSVSLFYKDLKNPIEWEQVTSNDEVTPNNREQAKVYGVEFEARGSLERLHPWGEDLSLGVNVTLSESQITTSKFEFENKEGQDTRPLMGHSKFLLNADITYDNQEIGTKASLLYNYYSERLILTSRVTPSIYEQPVGTLDFTISQRLTDWMKIKFTAKNLLDPRIEFTSSLKNEEIYSAYSKGRSYSISLTAEF